jgi:anti-sigma factor RsiW
MFDCANVEMRELLPELAAGTLDAPTRARVEAHVLSCSECASELETIRLVRASFSAASVIDTRRVVAALPKPPAPAVRPVARPGAARWMDWRAAAALTMITIGGLSVAIAQRGQDRTSKLDTAIATDIDSAVRIAQKLPAGEPKSSDTNSALTPPLRATAPRAAKVQLAFGGSADDDLDDASFAALMGALDEIDRGPIAPSGEPDPTPVLPVIRDGAR